MLSACAVGSDGGEAPVPMIPDAETGAATTTGSTTTGLPDDDDTTGVLPPPDSTGPDSTTTGPADDSTSSTTGGTGGECVNMSSCESARVIGQVSGDEDSPDLQASGFEPTWLTFRVTEDNDSAIGEDVRFTATLLSPDDYDFDLYVFRGAKGGTSGCGGVADESTSTGPMDLVGMIWGEGGVANGGDDSAWVAIQIRVKGGVCDPTAEWTLTVQGDT